MRKWIPRQQFAQMMRDKPTAPEKKLWKRLKNGVRGISFESQAVIAGYIVDFYAPAIKLAIELDGRQHTAKRDSLRDARIANEGVTVMRFRNPYTYQAAWRVFGKISNECWWRARRLKKGLPHSAPQKLTPFSHRIGSVNFSNLVKALPVREVSCGKSKRSRAKNGQLIEEIDTSIAQRLRKSLLKTTQTNRCQFCHGTGWNLSGEKAQRCLHRRKIPAALPEGVYA